MESVLNDEHSSSGSILVQYGAISSFCANYRSSMNSSLLLIAKSPALLQHCDLNLSGDFLRLVHDYTQGKVCE
jgi:hypothetical protein